MYFINLLAHFKSLSWKITKVNTYIGHTTTTHSHCLTYHLSDISAMKPLITKHNKDTDKLKSSKIRKILINHTKIVYKNDKNCLQILKAISN